MSLCTNCGRVYCDHTPAERGQTFKEMMRPLNAEEGAAFASHDGDLKMRVAEKHAHDPVG